MWQKTYRVRLTDRASRRPTVIAAWREDFAAFWPKGNDFYAPLTGIEPGEVALIKAAVAGRAEALDRRDGALRRRRVVHADDARRVTCSPAGSRSAPTRTTA